MAEFEKRLPKLGQDYIEKMRLPQKLAFTKMEGIGNDYVYVWFEDLDTPLTDPAPLAIFMSDRNYGVGGDGLVLIGKSKKADFRMRMFNNDGSEGNMCGNASRCVGKFLYEHGHTGKTNITLETKSGIRTLELTLENNKVASVTVDMGRPIVKPADIPMKADGETFINQEILVNGSCIKGTGVSMGNPHFVVTMHDIASLDCLLSDLFSNIMNSFPNGSIRNLLKCSTGKKCACVFGSAAPVKPLPAARAPAPFLSPACSIIIRTKKRLSNSGAESLSSNGLTTALSI